MRKVFKGSSEESREWKEEIYKSENLLCARHRVLLTRPKEQSPSVPHVGSKCSEKLRGWLKGTEPLGRT